LKLVTMREKSMNKTLLFGSVVFLVLVIGCDTAAGQSSSGQSAAPGMAASGQVKVAGTAATAAAQRALLDQYCVTCHNDKTKIDNFSLQKEDINAVGDHPGVWERVIRKLRAGMMPPPGMPRPPLAKYEGVHPARQRCQPARSLNRVRGQRSRRRRQPRARRDADARGGAHCAHALECVFVLSRESARLPASSAYADWRKRRHGSRGTASAGPHASTSWTSLSGN
jgi:hypothetical protein